VNEHDGQVWKLDPAADTMELVVLFGVNADPASDNFDGPDNITVAPWGGLVLCSDGEGAQHLFTVSADGEPAIFGKNVRDEGEFAGATFSADGTTLFVNLQSPGVTFAITGPWMS
jgi:secreted PhoX family phosphatase